MRNSVLKGLKFAALCSIVFDFLLSGLYAMLILYSKYRMNQMTGENLEETHSESWEEMREEA